VGAIERDRTVIPRDGFIRCDIFVGLCRGDCAKITPAHPYTIGLEGLPTSRTGPLDG
jgi:hypothetical protein